MCAKGSSPRIAAMPVSACAAVGSWSCFGCVTRSLARALRRMLASGEAIFSLASAAGCARFYKLLLAYECTGGRYAALRCVISSASQRRSCSQAVNRMRHRLGGWLVSGLSVNRDLGHHCRSTARVRSSPTKGRCIQEKPLVFRRARAAAFALSGAQSGKCCQQENKTTSRDTQERRWLPQGHLLCLIKTGFDRSVAARSGH